mmetsp:Transcript_12067/g.11791  ORF Transcript_12067/g.11791 Transcript_12067/m.11791 type:complete len:544 (-) Transcript_12067:74-1705(-)
MKRTMNKLPFGLLYYVLIVIFGNTTAVVNCEQEITDVVAHHRSVAVAAINSSDTDDHYQNNQSSREWKLHRLDLEKYPLATCLDGSPGAYYIRPGAADAVMNDSNNNKVFLHIEGGGWCCDTCSETCSERSKTYLGSTVNDTSNTLGDFSYEKAYYNMNKTINPAVWDFTSVYVRYCDGASLSGLREEPINITSSSNNNEGSTITTTQIYSRGNYILQAIIDELFYSGSGSGSGSSSSSSDYNGKLSSVEQLIVSGDSAGSLAVSLHVHQFVESINTNQTQMVVLLDSGFFRDYGNSEVEQGSYAEQMKSIYEMSHAKYSLPLACIHEYQGNTDGDDAVVKCMFAANHIPYISVPIFIIQSKYDAWQLYNELGYNSIDNTSAAAIDDVNQYGTALEDELMTAINSQRILQPKSKISLSSCEFHTVLGGWNDSDEDLNKVWLKASINGTTVNLAFNEWLNDVLRRPIDDNKNIDNDQLESVLVSDEVFPCEECCDIILYEESSSTSPPSQPSSSSSSSKNDLSYYQANRFRAAVVVVVSVAAML